ncbi:MAG: DUF1579 domain-containing protein [Isosphaeraceae bacterium]
MGRRAREVVACWVVMLAAGVPSAYAQEGAPPFPKPTKEHQLLETEVGDWDGEVTMWLDPKAPPVKAKATESNTMMPGGIWLLSSYSSEFAGSPFHGRGQFTYDPVKKKYVGTWIDSMVTTPMLMEGSYDPSKKTLTYEGESPDPSGKMVKTRTATTHHDDGSRTMTLWMKSDEAGPDWVKWMEVRYRKKAPSK